MTDQALSDLLRDRGQRVTSQRLVINRFLDEHEGT
jgi:Fe2+ or Zn2+ uptake regulation protein